MLSNYMMSNTRTITKICYCAELTDTLNTWWKRFTMIIIILCSFEIFTSCQGLIRTFSKHCSKCKTVQIKFRKTLQERRLIFAGLPAKEFLNFLTSKYILIILQYSWDIFGIFLKQTFVECSSNILETLLCD